MKWPRLGLVLLALTTFSTGARAGEYHVALDGSDETGDGSAGNPWRTIGYAVNAGIPAGGGDTVLVGDGTYEGQVGVQRSFGDEVTVRAENPYRAILRNVEEGSEVLRIFQNAPVNITFSGFVFTKLHPSYDCPGGRESYFAIHIQDASNVTIRDNIIYGNNAPGGCNELLKVNRSADTYPSGITIEGNLFYESANARGADMIDAVRAGEIDIQDNIFFGNPAHGQSQSFITLKRQAPASAPRRPRYRIRRNVFLTWGGFGDQAFVQFGEDGVAEHEITDAVVENNLFVGNSPQSFSAPVQLKGTRGVVVRANTIAGDTPGGAFGLRVGTEGENPTVADIEVRNNIFSDPTGTMGARLVATYGDVDLGSFTLDHNLYYNDGNALPTQGSPTPADDQGALEGDPLLETDYSQLELPRWDEPSGTFPSGSTTIAQEHARLVELYAAIGAGSPAIGAADAANMPDDDIRGLARDDSPDIGAYEHGATTTAPPEGDGGTGPSGSNGGCGCQARERGPLSLLTGLFVVLLSLRRRAAALGRASGSRRRS